MEMTNQMETRKYWASVLAFWSYWVQSIVMSWSIAWAGTQRAGDAAEGRLPDPDHGRSQQRQGLAH